MKAIQRSMYLLPVIVFIVGYSIEPARYDLWNLSVNISVGHRSWICNYWRGIQIDLGKGLSMRDEDFTSDRRN